MEKTIKISIIIPIYNSERTLGKLLNILLMQLPSNAQLILIDDGSTDNTSEILKIHLKNNTNILHKRIEKSGVSTARNEGLKMAKGEYVTFVDSDDEVASNYFDVINELIEDKNIDLFLFGCVIHGPNKNEIYSPINLTYEKNLFLMNPIFFDPAVLNFPWNKIYKRKIIDEFEIMFDESIGIAEDFGFNVKFLKKANQIKTSKEVLYYYNRMIPNSITNTRHSFKTDIEIKILTELNEMIDTTNFELERNYFKYLVNIFIGLVKSDYINENLDTNTCKNNFIKAKKIIEYRNINFDDKRQLIDCTFLFLIKKLKYEQFIFIIKNYNFFSTIYLKIRK
ncbi:glycosyltransferase family 2 protein [Anaerorhabdus furcosa]|uniref:Glycosyltransferase involved in cell wall bisynthesis n=1 Tax=Anaerorhabdus furcosa TaxID=118967 RepID=A0A1T4LQ76_9FIRM|nr:glycosyltransferase family 2 protein [Anaerorhabdus furcosa]SJZ56688.1 Glycosyltransferase involved in cell wall bisynthesis [Anaerorhabdus furcosa]